MDSRFKIIVSSKNIYKEIELPTDAKEVKLGTGLDCDVRLHKSLFFDQIELVFSKVDSGWSVLCSDNLYLTAGDVRKLITKNLVHGDSLTVKYQSSDNEVFSFEFLIDFDNGKTKYERIIDLSDINSFMIGSANTSNIVIGSSYVNGDEIEITKKSTSLLLRVIHSNYGVYHNGNRIEGQAEIKSGDFFSISDFFFCFKNETLWTEIRPDMSVNSLNYRDMPTPNAYPKFNRNTRLKSIVNEDQIEVLDPPTKPQKPKNNLLTRLLPSMGMLVASGIMAFFGGTMIIFSVVSGVMAIVTSVVTLKEGNKEYKKSLEERIVKYNAYIENKRKEVENCRQIEKVALETTYISQENEKSRFNEFSPMLFDRTPEDEDFLCVNLGDGSVESKRKIKYKKQERLEIEDDLQLQPERLSNEYRYIQAAPVICDLKVVNAIGIVGNEQFRFCLFKNIIIDIIARQYFTDVKMVFVAEEKNADKVTWLRMLPYVNTDDTKLKTIVYDNESKNFVFEYLYKELSIREQNKKYSNHIIIFLYDEYGFKNHPVSKFVKQAKKLGVTFIFFGFQPTDIPLGCGHIISQSNDGMGSLVSTDDSSIATEFRYPVISEQDACKIVDLLAPVYSEEISLEGSLTKSISMFEMLNIIAVDDLNLEDRWNKSQVFKSMAAPIGVSKSGITYLDLHDKAHGPHGLVAGTTGSGKSEILQTYILSVSTLFHPYEIAFVIIDFKGGGMVNQFKNLPHLLGAITNIDGKEIVRSLKSIKAELQKRQRLFAEADVNHIDKYIRKYKSGEVETPLPHLVLIVDEFAELKAEQPEFMKELISAARIGRSLGVHLILATQKPSGQVNEQIWSNSRFKLCLKVQSQEDSNEVIKSPLAAEIKEPGRAYLQVGNNEIFELFQSAYSGVPEKTEDLSVKEFTIYSLSACGRRSPVFVQKRSNSEGTNTTQLDAIVEYVSDYCDSISLKRLPNICLPPLDDYITVPGKDEKLTLEALPLGVYDDPDSQYQGMAHFNLCEENTLIVGSSLTGKTNLIQVVLRLVAENFSPKEAIFYIADFGSMYLKNFESMNHVGGIVTISEGEKLKNLFKLLTEEVQHRKTKFLECGLSSYAAYKEAGYDDLPHIFFIVDNFSAFKEVYADSYEDQFIYLSREGLTYGISIIVTSVTSASLGYRYMSNFACRFASTCNDSSEYINVFDRCRMQPKDVPGRLLCKLNKELFEMQSFIAFEGVKEIERSNEVRKFVDSVNSKYTGVCAKKIPNIPETLTFAYLDENYETEKGGYQYPVALDYSDVNIVWLDLKTTNELCVVGKLSEKNLAVTNSILSALHHYVLSKPIKLFIIDSVDRPLKSKADYPYVEKYTIDYSEIGTIFDEISPELELRHELLMDGKFDELQKKSQIIILINSRDAIEYISSTKELYGVYGKMTKQFKSLNLSFIFSDIEDISVGYNAPELLKRFKEAKKMIITSPLQEYKFCDLPSNAVRNNKMVNVGDCFVLSGTEILRVKFAEEDFV